VLPKEITIAATVNIAVIKKICFELFFFVRLSIIPPI
jgi:hypothetical protein